MKKMLSQNLKNEIMTNRNAQELNFIFLIFYLYMLEICISQGRFCL